MTDRVVGPGLGAEATPRGGRDFIVEIAWLHHELGLTQDAIAVRMGVSRSTISRALTQAEALGIVQVIVTEPPPESARLADALRQRFGIVAHVGLGSGGEDPQAAAARAAARLIERAVMSAGVVLAASWGRTLAKAASAVRPRRTSDVALVDAVGHASGGALTPAVEVTSRLASALGAPTVHVPSPAFADSASSLGFLLASQPVRQALDLARGADVTLVSVGLAGEVSLLRQAELMSAAAMESAVKDGAVGEILGSYYDAAGRFVAVPGVFPVALTLEELRRSRRVVAVAAGAEKGPALAGALAGRVVGEIVVDEALARALLR